MHRHQQPPPSDKPRLSPTRSPPQELLDPVNSQALSDADLQSMVFAMTSTLERLSLEQQDTQSLALHMDLYARVRGARGRGGNRTCAESSGGLGEAS